jgi:hypothetical protein
MAHQEFQRPLIEEAFFASIGSFPLYPLPCPPGSLNNDEALAQGEITFSRAFSRGNAVPCWAD